MANDIAVAIVSKLEITKTRTGHEYYEAMETGSKYWESVLAGRPDPVAKEAADRALSRLLNCRAQVSGTVRTNKTTWKDKILRAFS